MENVELLQLLSVKLFANEIAMLNAERRMHRNNGICLLHLSFLIREVTHIREEGIRTLMEVTL